MEQKDVLINRANTIINETQYFANNGPRVGGLIKDVIEYADNISPISDSEFFEGNTGLSVQGEALQAGNIWTNIISSKTGESVNYEIVGTWVDGSEMDDSKVDGVIYRKRGDEYLKLCYSERVNAKWFGAKGDGITDDTTSIQSAIDFTASIGGGTVYIPQGKYRTTSTLYLKSNVAIEGDSSLIYATKVENFTTIFADFENPYAWAIDTYNVLTNTGNPLAYDSSTSGAVFDNGGIHATYNVKACNIDIEAINQPIFGGIRFSVSPYFLRKNIRIRNTYIGCMLNASWVGTDENISAESLYLSFVYVTDTNSFSIKNCVSSIPYLTEHMDESFVPKIVYSQLSQKNYLDKSVGLFASYMYGVDITGFCSEKGNIAKMYLSCNGLTESAYYMEGVKDYYWYLQGTKATINEGFHLSSDTAKGFKLNMNNNVIMNNDIAATLLNESTPFDLIITPYLDYYIKNPINIPSFITNNGEILFISEDTTLYPGAGFGAIYGSGTRSPYYRPVDYWRTLRPEKKSLIKEIRIAEKCPINIPNDRRFEIANPLMILGEGTIKPIFTSNVRWIDFFRITADVTFKNLSFKASALGDGSLYRELMTVFGDLTIKFIDCDIDLTSSNPNAFLFGSTLTISSAGQITDYGKSALSLYFENCNITGVGMITRTNDITVKSVTLKNTTISNDVLIRGNCGFASMPLHHSEFSKAGDTTNRPVFASGFVGFQYYDITLNKTIFWNGSSWVDVYGLNLIKSGTTANRPNSNLTIGFTYFDSTINKAIVWNGSIWVNMDGSDLINI